MYSIQLFCFVEVNFSPRAKIINNRYYNNNIGEIRYNFFLMKI